MSKLVPSVPRHIERPFVYTNGCFDLLHEGHISFLEYCSTLGGSLIVGVTPDKVVREKKGVHRPIRTQDGRLSTIQALRLVDFAFVTPEQTDTHAFVGMTVLDAIRPEYFVTSDVNWLNDTAWLESLGVRLEVAEFAERNISTTSIIQRIIDSSGGSNLDVPM